MGKQLTVAQHKNLMKNEAMSDYVMVVLHLKSCFNFVMRFQKWKVVLRLMKVKAKIILIQKPVQLGM